MALAKESLQKDLEHRGLIQDSSDPELFNKLPEGCSFYVGMDPTAPSLQIGNLLVLFTMARIALAGFKPIVLFGGATGAIGDPSGKSEERKLLSRDVITQNIERQQNKTTEIFKRLGADVSFVDNLDWTQDVTFLEFLRDVGKNFTVNYMIAKEVVKARLGGSGISYTEFSYMLLQANDFLHLFQNHNCKMQAGGSDQWGNITAGLELIRKVEQQEAFAFSWPLLTDSQGRKFGKSEAGAIWLDESRTSPFKFHQFWLNVDDADVVRYLRIFTFLEESEVQKYEQLVADAPEERAAQKKLADEVCTLVHGESATDAAKKSAGVLFGGSLEGIDEHQLADIFSDVPSSSIERNELSNLSLVEVFTKSGLSQSKGDAKRLIANGGAYVNNERVNDPGKKVEELLESNCGLFVLRSGKKKYHLVKIQNG